jgi:hypothetical protein
MPKWCRLKWENPFEWSCRKPHSKGSRANQTEAASKEQNRSKGNICIQMIQRGRKKVSRKTQFQRSLAFEGTYLENMGARNRAYPLSQKEIAPQAMTSVMTLGFFELSRHPLQG